MRNLLAASAATAWMLAASVGAPVFAADATVDQIYEAARSGHLDQAQTMMDQVLKDHPTSGKAHYVQAELYAKEGKTALARSQLGQAEQLDPGLSHENANSVAELKAQLGMSARIPEGSRVIGMSPHPASHFPWGMALVFVIAILVLWTLFRRRPTYSQYPSGGAPVLGGGPGTYGGPGGYGAAGPVAGGGIGSGIAGGLASGLAVGAGVVAGEELAHHFLDGGSREAVPQNRETSDDWSQSNNSDMGGNDFGVNDSGSWDDSGGGGGGGGGDDWS